MQIFVYLQASHTQRQIGALRKPRCGDRTREKKKSKVKKEKKKKRKPDLRSLALESVQHSLERRLAEATVYTGLFIGLESVTESFGAVVESVAKGFVDALDVMPTSHKDLFGQHSNSHYVERKKEKRRGPYPFKGR